MTALSIYQVQDKKIAARFQFIEHAHKKILFLDYSHGDRETCFALTAEFERYIQGLEADGSLRILFDLKGPYYDPAHANHWKANAARYEKYFHATAMLNVDAIFKVILSGVRLYTKMLGKPMHEKRGRLFDDRQAALDFLSED